MNNEVLIVGAGPSGLALAISLSNQGVPYQVRVHMIRKAVEIQF
ncbi:MAG: FAD-dependent monooxygenase [Mammaliicoccus vitulinus]|nr:FAD-dependent monooxygenase [Mammaliicoccus vitulinus]